MKIRILLALALILLTRPVQAFEGPLEVKNQYPLFLPLLPPRLESALTCSSFSVDLSHSSVFMIKNASRWSVNLDMEITEVAFRFRKELPNSFELGLELPLQSFESGFMDSFLEDYHNLFGFPDYGRSSRPGNQFLYEVRRDGFLVVKGENGKIGLGDIRLSAKKVLIKADPAVSIKAELQLPTGEPSEGFGTGGMNYALSVLADKRISEIFMTYWNSGVIFPGDLRAMQKIELRRSLFGGAALEAMVCRKFGLLGQVLFQTSPYPRTGIGSVDRVSALLSFGGRYHFGGNGLEFSITEDPNTAGAPDVTFTIGCKMNF